MAESINKKNFHHLGYFDHSGGGRGGLVSYNYMYLISFIRSTLKLEMQYKKDMHFSLRTEGQFT